jgi:hypothetical protein
MRHRFPCSRNSHTLRQSALIQPSLGSYCGQVCGYISFLVVILAATASAQTSSNILCIVSRPVGFVKISILSNEQKLVSLPFKPFDPSINSILSGQLTGSVDERTADRIYKWRSDILQYEYAVKVDGDGRPDVDGRWFSDLQQLIPSDMMLEPGEGFFIWNRQSKTQDVLLAGEVVLAATNAVILQPSFNLVGYSYSTSIKVEECEAWNDLRWDFSAMPDFIMGKGFWCDNKWEETWLIDIRPYEDVFPVGSEPPHVSSIRVEK